MDGKLDHHCGNLRGIIRFWVFIPDMKLLPYFCLMPGFSAHLQAAPQSFPDPRMAIEAANSDGKLMIFQLVDRFSKEGKAVEEAVIDQIKDRDGEFVIARCNAGSKAYRAMVTYRFKKRRVTRSGGRS